MPQKPIYFSVAPEIYNAYLGEYEFKNGLIKVNKKDDALFFQIAQQAPFQLYPKSPLEFFAKTVNATVVFVKSSLGQVTELSLRQNGTSISAKKVK
ncbi:DUF3471 domain-containing protein [Chlorogloeopsis fritschii PCC 9212]|uniref:Peptidase S12 Pab87-related C-terminal domain-containing protein n=1 Tax=Chlorogloeopsis fritschii PCC 6912 TaxID=211165 RepID=A0A3S0ZSE8_CHLFR|nr:DUF3471 domain-containing protein [Chlorogloeopsis fritschii]RUR76439.1 hypothetical protein PCC6912_42270 [Chlorogloeopsis fritschii PCC 6912]